MSKLVKGWIREPGPLKRGPGTLITMSGLLVLKPCQCSSMQLRAVWQDYGFRRLNYMPARGAHSLCSRPPHHLNDMGRTLLTRFQQLLKIEDLKSYHREALVLTPPDHAGRPVSLHNLANAIYTRFKRLRSIDMEQLEECQA